MKNFIVIFIGLFIFAGCSKSSPDTPPKECEECDWWNGYFTDTTGLNIVYYEFIDNDLRIAGTKSGRLWVSIFNQDDKKLVFDFVDNEEFKPQRIFDRGWGNFETINLEISRIDVFDVSSYKEILIWYAKASAGDMIICNDNKIIYKKLSNDKISYSGAYSWFDDNIIVSTHLYNNSRQNICVSGNGKELLIINPNVEFNNLTPVSIEEGIYESDSFGFNGEYWRNYYYRQNIKTGQKKWDHEVVYDDIQEKAKINVESSKMNSIWLYTLNITNYDGSKETRSFKIDIETGELIKQ